MERWKPAFSELAADLEPAGGDAMTTPMSPLLLHRRAPTQLISPLVVVVSRGAPSGENCGTEYSIYRVQSQFLHLYQVQENTSRTSLNSDGDIVL